MKKEKIIVKNNDHLNILIKREIQENGNKCNLNHLDVSSITDLSNLFNMSIFEGDISEWDTSNVKNMAGMFDASRFNGNISEWDVSKVENMSYMFYNSNFIGNISRWNTNKLEFTSFMFGKSIFNGDIKPYIDKYWAEKEKQLLIEQNNNVKLSSKKEKFKI